MGTSLDLVIGKRYTYEEVLSFHRNGDYPRYGFSYRSSELRDKVFILKEVQIADIGKLYYPSFSELKERLKKKPNDDILTTECKFISDLIEAYKRGDALPPLVLEKKYQCFGIIDGAHRSSALADMGVVKTLSFTKQED